RQGDSRKRTQPTVATLLAPHLVEELASSCLLSTEGASGILLRHQVVMWSRDSQFITPGSHGMAVRSLRTG
ncbi:MAG: hypothetical protein AB7H80_14510, partial [Candidatus Kapaibacterium sp.]